MAFHIVQNTEGTMEVTVRDSAKVLIDFTGASAVVWRMEDDNHNNVIDDVAGAFDADRTSGKLTYTFTLSDTVIAGNFAGRFRVTASDGHIEAYPRPGKISISIEGEVDDG